MVTTKKKLEAANQTAGHDRTRDLEQTRFVDLYALDGPIEHMEINADSIEAMLNLIPTREELAARS